MKTRRLLERIALLAIGDGVVGLLAPRCHSRLWMMGPAPWRTSMRWLTRHPLLVRLLALLQGGFGLWLAFRQYAARDEAETAAPSS